MNRQEANKELLLLLSKYLDEYPCMRFAQALSNLRIIPRHDVYEVDDHYYDESEMTLKRAEAALDLASQKISLDPK